MKSWQLETARQSTWEEKASQRENCRDLWGRAPSKCSAEYELAGISKKTTCAWEKKWANGKDKTIPGAQTDLGKLDVLQARVENTIIHGTLGRIIGRILF